MNSTLLNDPQVHKDAFAYAIDKIKAKAIDLDPFPHIYIEQIFPPEYYHALLARIANVGRFVPSFYPGVAVDLDAKTFRDHGLTCENFVDDTELSHIYRHLESDQFSRVLLEKFSAPDSWGDHGSAIPVEKHLNFKAGRDDFTCVFDLHKDLPGYEITPHPDVPSKIITFLFYFTPSNDVNQFGTILCKMKPDDLPTTRHVGYSKLGRLFSGAAQPFIGKNAGFAQKSNWTPWERCESQKMAEARPNSLLVFAPNSRSFHAVRMDIPPDNPVQERQTLRGFIRAGKNSRNYTTRYSHRFGRKLMFGLVRQIRSLSSRTSVNKIKNESRALESHHSRDWAYLSSRAKFVPRNLVLEMAVRLSFQTQGNIVEFGVANGHSTRIIRNIATDCEDNSSFEPKNIYAFDSFEGLREKFENAEIGTFKTNPPTIPGVNIVRGYFEDSLTDDLRKIVGSVAFASLDADLFSSTLCALRWLTPMLHPGSLLLFDEFIGEKESEKRAFERWSVESGVETMMIADFVRDPSGWSANLDRRCLFQVIGKK